MRIQVITALLIVVGSHFFAPTALAATFNVTSTSCAGPASLSEAIRAANVTPGADTIEIASGLTIRGDCDMGVLPDDSMLLVTESVTINGNGSTLHGANAYVDQAGSTNPYSGDTCPSNAGRAYILMGVSPSLLQVGERGPVGSPVDNAGVDLTISNFNINSLSQLAAVRQGASLTLKDVKADNISDLQYCFRSAIEAFDRANVTLENVEFRGARGYDRNALGHIYGQDGKLEIYDSMFAQNDDRYAVAWQGDADIVTSSFTGSGGLWVSGSGTMRVINSRFRPQRQGTTLDGWDGFLVNLGGRLEFEASTVLIHVNECPVRNDRGNCNVSGIRGSTATFFSNNNSVIDFKQSAIHVQTLNPIFSPSQTSLLEASNGGAFTADQYTFIQPLGWQDASALNALVTTAGGTLITGPGALPTLLATDNGLGAFAFNFPEDITPIVAGPLEGAIPDAITTNLLKDPRGSNIDFDILGASRNTGPTRSIGAVEGGPLYLAARIEPSTPFTADLSWSKPLSATGYDLCQGVGTPPSGLTGTTTACPSDFTPDFSTNRDTVSGRVSNLPPNSETHWFLVRATDSGTPGLWSNVQVVTVPVTITYPTTVIGTSNLVVSPVVTGLLVNPTYQPLSGTLPRDFSLVVPSGDLFITPTGTCTPTAIGILVIAGSGDVTSTSASFSCPTSVPASAPILSYPNRTTLYENSAGNIVTPKVVGLLATGTPNFTLTSGTLPAGLTLDPATGVISGDLGGGTANTYPLQVQVTQSGLPPGTSNSFDLVILGGAPSPQLSYPDVDVPAGTTGLVITPAISGFSSPPILFRLLSSGSQLPTGLVLDEFTGVISGIPITATDGIISVDISATNGSQERVSFVDIQVQPTLSYPATIGTVGDPLVISPVVSLSTVSGIFSITSGALPSGLILDATTGVISGTPLNAGQASAAVTYTQTGGQTQLVTATVNITVQSVGSPAAIPSLPIGGIVLLVAAIAWIGARKFRPKGGAVWVPPS